MFAGLLYGVAIGMAAAAAMAWYFNMGTRGFSVVDPPADTAAEAQSVPASAIKKGPAAPELPRHASPEPAALAPDPVTPAAPPPAKAVASKPPAVVVTRPAEPTKTDKPAFSNYTFYRILPGEKPPKDIGPMPSQDIWWLQIAALSDAQKAEQIRARLAALNLRARTQKIDSNGQPLYRIRVGPYKREDDAFGDLDILTQNDLNARLLKDVTPETAKAAPDKAR